MDDYMTNFSSLDEFRNLKAGYDPAIKFNGFIIIPTDERHDSGYRIMKLALTYHGVVVGCIEGCCDVIHLNGIGGYGAYDDGYDKRVRERKGPIIDWSIDCAPNGLVRVFCSKCLTFPDLALCCSDLQIIVKEEAKDDKEAKVDKITFDRTNSK